ncbi:MAG: type II toxin-antitoxin system RelE/ParE family toxin [Anaerolineae bacterium]|nr:type II toxin-antitoxin system RelE/ParE family toxin [Anaerolineae bacterium]
MTEGASWRALLHREAEHELRRLPKNVVARVWRRIQKRALDPLPEDAVALQGHPGLYRLRVGDWRLIYHLDQMPRIVTIVRIGHRGDVYRTL